MRNKSYVLTLLFLVAAFSGYCQISYSNPDRFEKYSLGSIKPSGWIKAQMERDLEDGLTGHFDQINPTVTHNLFIHSNRYSGRQYDQMKSWWSGEHEGYWKESVLCIAFLTDNATYKKIAKNWIDDILASTDSSGYMGIYYKSLEPNSRYMHVGENGELWTQSFVFRMMLSYYEFTGDPKVLKAVEKGVHLTMKAYAETNPFLNGEGGVSHGIGFFYILKWLSCITNDLSYDEFALKLYRDLNNSNIRDDDFTLINLMDSVRMFQAHGAHVSEAFFIPWYLKSIKGGPDMENVCKNTWKKLNYSTSSGGAMVCDEDVRGQKGKSDGFYEYCTNVEMVNSLTTVLSLTADLSIADHIEKLTFNALQGARLADLKALSYLTSDNRLQTDSIKQGGREVYDACHAAACCALNGGRLMPFYVQSMWMRDSLDKGLIATLYGPCMLKTQIDGVNVNIQEDTQYPFSDEIGFDVSASENKKFAICLRKPFHVTKIKISGISEKEMSDFGGYVVINREWGQNNKFRIQFDFDIKKIEQPKSQSEEKNEYYFQRGPIVYALPFPCQMDTVKEHGESKFYQLVMSPTDSLGWDYMLQKDPHISFFKTDNKNYLHPFDNPLMGLNCKFVESKRKISLVPMGNTILRRVTFPQDDEKFIKTIE